MIKFEQITDKEPILEEGKPFIDKEGNKHVLLSSDIHCIFPIEIDNGNDSISADLAMMIKEEKLHVCSNVLDYCPGYGCIGLDMLALGTTNHVTFADNIETSVRHCLETAQNNSILFYTTGYVLDSISDIPESDKFDIVVATLNGDDTKYKDFFKNIYMYLTKYADIYLVEERNNISLQTSKIYDLKNIYYLKSFPLGSKTILHYKLSHSHLE